MRSTIALVCVLVACGRGERSNSPASQATSGVGGARAAVGHEPDALLLRVPRSGGLGRVVGYPAIDSTIWTTSDAVPSLDRVLGFDLEAGTIAAVDTRGEPLWIDLRIGGVLIPSRSTLTGLVSLNGGAIFGVGTDGAVVRFTQSGNWVFKSRIAARAVFPQPNGTVIALVGAGPSSMLIRLHPPDIRIVDSLMLGPVRSGTGAPLGDRIYFTSGDGSLVRVRARTLVAGDHIALGHAVVAMAATPSGDRFYAITDSSRILTIIDGFQDRVGGQIELPGLARDLRVDPLGRVVLVRPATGDSVWVVSVGTNQIAGTVRTAWRSDLPLVAADGAIAIVAGPDVAFVDPASRRELRRVSGGASDFWYAFGWGGFRPRAAVLDTPPRFSGDSDTAVRRAAPPRDTAVRRPPPVDSAKLGFTLSFAVLLDEAAARAQAAKTVVEGQTARVVTGTSDGTPIFRVVLGPYSTRDEADRVGRASGRSYYVYAGPP